MPLVKPHYRLNSLGHLYMDDYCVGYFFNRKFYWIEYWYPKPVAKGVSWLVS